MTAAALACSVLASAIALATASPAGAVPVVFTTSDTELVPDTDNQGWYTGRGEHALQNDNYLIGHNGADAFRNFFVFDLSTLDLTGLVVASARLEVQRYNASTLIEGYVFEYGLFDVGTDAATLMADHPGPLPNADGVDVYEDLGSGASYGSLAVDPLAGDADDLLQFDLSAAALADLGAAAGGFFAIGGAITNLQFNAGTIHAGSGGIGDGMQPPVRDPGIQRLVIEVVPEPGTLLLVGGGLALLSRRASASAGPRRPRRLSR
ncbi:MAG: hypothetical protein DCC71_03850 [Proteobacteria bacterium]|nr:MAG: hypothetical protein DCC71_03850 [Pseudomonadota bacterium]